MRTTQQARFRRPRPAIVAGCLFSLLLLGCDEPKQAAPPPSPPKVVLAEVAKQSVPITIDASGTTAAVKHVQILPRVSGYIFERYYTEGTFVDEGAALYLIDPRPYQDKLDRLKAELKGHEASLAFWQSEDARYAKLSKQGAASVEQAEGARAKLELAQADIAQTKVEIRNAELDVSYTEIKAPFHGRIQESLIKAGALVTAEQDVLTTLVQMNPIHVSFNLSRSDVFEIQKLREQGLGFAIEDMMVQVMLPDGKLYQNDGKVDFVSTQIDPTTDSVDVRGIFDNLKYQKYGDFYLVPGQYVPVLLTVGEMPDSLVIPQTAIVETQAGQAVYVVGDDNKVEHRSIKTGATDKQSIVVTEGLKAGEKVVAVGVQKVKQGIEVEPTAPAKPGSSDKAESSAKQES